MTQYKEHSDIVIPACLDNSDYVDTSWHNDACASSESTYKLVGGIKIHVWVSEDNPDKREMSIAKFMICLQDSDSMNDDLVCETEYEYILQAVLSCLRARYEAIS